MTGIKTTKLPDKKTDPMHRDESKVSNRDKGAPPDSRKVKGDQR